MNVNAQSTEVGHLIVTVQQRILREQRKRFPNATGAFSWLLSGITLAAKMTQASDIHQRVPLIVGGKTETNDFYRCMNRQSRGGDISPKPIPIL